MLEAKVVSAQSVEFENELAFQEAEVLGDLTKFASGETIKVEVVSYNVLKKVWIAKLCS